MAFLLDAALRQEHPLSFFDMVVATFKMIDRRADGMQAAWMGCLYAEGEMEVLMSLRAAWLRGEDRSPETAARNAARCDF